MFLNAAGRLEKPNLISPEIWLKTFINSLRTDIFAASLLQRTTENNMDEIISRSY